tara:strand:+ start:604 stop:828 length:225 start_codon:yes stop_codon:yes gene_type:complete
MPISKIALTSKDDDLGIVPNGELTPLGDKRVKFSPVDKPRFEANLEPITTSPLFRISMFPVITFLLIISRDFKD